MNDETENDVLMSVGECLHSWSYVEVEISNLFTILHCIKRDDFTHPTRAAFEAVISLEVRLAMLVAYVNADKEIRDAYLPHVKCLISRIYKLYKKRHEIAHFMIVFRGENPKSLRPFVRPFFTVDAFVKNKGTELDINQVNERAAKFCDLSSRIRRHVQHVGALRKLPLEYYVQAGDIAFPPLDVRDLIQEESAPPPPPILE